MEEINACINCEHEPTEVVVVCWHSRVFMRFGVCETHKLEAISIVCDPNGWAYRVEPAPAIKAH